MSLELLRLVGARLLHVLDGAVHVVGEGGEDADLMVERGLVHVLLRGADGHEERPADQRVFLRLALARLPPLLVGASEKVLPDFALRQDRVAAHAVNEALQLAHAVVQELFLVTACAGWRKRQLAKGTNVDIGSIMHVRD